MIDGIQIKVCGLTSQRDAEAADIAGVDYMGFNFYPKSPRHISPEGYRAMAKGLPRRKRVAVVVEPTADELLALKAMKFDRFQVHFRHDIGNGSIKAWSAAVGPGNLWLAPKLPPEVDVPTSWLALANAVLLDTFDKTLYGGTGRIGDWPKFKRHQEGHPATVWILSGGLNAENVGVALKGTGARFLDVNSGVESKPGVKDLEKLKAFGEAIHAAAG